MKSPQEVFADYLAGKNLKTTPQRRLILDTLLKQGGHLSSEELYAKVKKRDSSIGQATVYRTLKLLNESGLIEPLDFADGVTRYEPSYGEEHHDHLICERCGNNIEILDKTIENRQEELAKEHGFTLVRHKMYLYGVCPECRKKKG
ncbi:MAG: transcriptional repressor [Pseudodesulfovibrio sp.]|uniref:Ferric uptake regulation protein n=1 Tax=Pseudodesulfovibrio aespoeensis (strain ATCC 700646 / DSM 10631 / Aspo-2) TaxID=643562 RepID=E6VS76_PSEA9|nr:MULTISPECIES: Fur family transcriptional regulator [Pseudodesulfovibrio]MBU4193162.1 transcriptional repressor [Pseudomonadota bacterium]ADU63121.1 ferric-uptake regulator [Pseudodesulfovibrio aespoeensis Aspo-2]MBU4245065.1 transcriptional repressor [Pseudomonadota bacterium]MBU4379558.1 transcriptional repressor [Pseudomonadota bacterium]MBU4475075.1 transcriptional repressor [Pseudomonadota bacterium]